MNLNKEDVKKYCLEKWGYDGSENRLRRFSDSFDDWISQVPKDCQNIVLTLVKNITYYPHQDINKWLVELHNRMMNSNKEITGDNTIFTFIKSKDGKTNSSNDYWTEYKLLNDLNKNICYEDITAITDEQWNYINNIVLIDDFSGSGNSFETYIIDYLKCIKNKNVFFITIDIMQEAIDVLLAFAQEKDFNLFIFNMFTSEKAFEKDYFENNEVAKSKIVDMSNKFNISEKWVLGFEESQALIVFYNNTPNNTLGFIWNNTNTYQSIFPRRFDYVPSWQNLKKNKKNREIANYNNSIKGNTYG